MYMQFLMNEILVEKQILPVNLLLQYICFTWKYDKDWASIPMDRTFSDVLSDATLCRSPDHRESGLQRNWYTKNHFNLPLYSWITLLQKCISIIHRLYERTRFSYYMSIAHLSYRVSESNVQKSEQNFISKMMSSTSTRSCMISCLHLVLLQHLLCSILTLSFRWSAQLYSQ